MFRILGFILGSAVSVAGIFFVLGVPEINSSSFESDQARFDAALEKIRQKQSVVEELAAQPPAAEPATGESENIDENIAAIVTPEQGILPVDSELPAEPQDLFDPQQRWYEFWNPFRSEIAAQGFVSQLEKVTGLDYRIIKVATGVYQVEFAYSSDDERRMKLSRISAATGLDLPQT
jgi:hypothetical protein